MRQEHKPAATHILTGGLVPLTGGQGTEVMAAKLEAAGWETLNSKRFRLDIVKVGWRWNVV